MAHSDRAHSELSASSAGRWMNCPGSVRLLRTLPRGEGSSAAAARGTAMHEVAELCLVQKMDALEFVDATFEGVTITAEMAETVQVFLDDCRATPGEWRIEVQFDLYELDPPAPMFGTADFVSYDAAAQKLYVKDLKTGYMPVDVFGNPQLRYYAIGALLSLELGKPVDQIEVTIVQPNGADGEPIKRETFSNQELQLWAGSLIRRACATQDPDAPLVPGPWCDKHFCPARAICPARAQQALAVAQLEFADVVFLGETEFAPPAINLLIAEQRGAILRDAPILESWLKDLRAFELAEQLAGRGSSQWKVIEGEARRRSRWRDEDAAAAELASVLPSDERYERRLVSPAKAEAAIARRMGHATKRDREAAAKGWIADLITKPTGAPTLAPITDTRAALPAGGSEFFALPDETEGQ